MEEENKEENIQDEPGLGGEVEETPTEPVEKETPETPVEEPCDPQTMSCNEMRDKILSLADEKQKVKLGIKGLETVREIIDDPSIEKAYDTAVEKNKKIDEDLKGTLDSFMACNLSPKPEEEKKEGEKPEIPIPE